MYSTCVMAMKNRNVIRRLLCAWFTVPTFPWALSGRTTDLNDRKRKNAFAKKKYKHIRA